MFRLFFVLIIALLLINIWFYAVYLSVINKKNKVCSAYTELDIQLKQRYDLVPHILMAVRNIMNNENQVLDEAVRLRNELLTIGTKYENIDRRLALDYELGKMMSQIISSAENYSQLNSEQNFLSAVSSYNDSEKNILQSVKTYNEAAINLKIATEVFPSSFISRLKLIKNVDTYRV